MKPHALACLLMLAACASASEPEPAAPAAPRVVATILPADAAVSRVAGEQPAGAYTLDPRHTNVHWRLRHWGLGLSTGRFDTTNGTLNFDPADPANSSVSVRIAVNSVSTGILNRAGERAFDADIAAWLGGEAHPEIAFTSRTIELTGPTTGRISGDLSFNGQTHPVTLDAEFTGGRVIPTSNRHTIAFTARTMIERSRWVSAVLHNSASPGEEVEILISAEFVHTPPAG